MKALALEQPYGRSAMDLVPSSRPLRVLSRWMVGLLVVTAIVLVVTPWQQTAPGSGRVVAYVPEERQQNVEAPIEGRVSRWYVREGSVVKAGDPIVELSDNDPEILTRLRAERDSIEARRQAALDRARSLESRIAALVASRLTAVAAAEERARMAQQRVLAAEQAEELAVAGLSTARLNLERQRTLAQRGLTSTRLLELTELEQTRASTELERARMALSAARSERLAFGSDRHKVDTDALAAVDDARASRAAAEAEAANASAELARVEVRVARQSAQSVLAPRAGSVLRIVANGHIGEVVKAGDVLATLVPETTDRAVELWISGNDMPLVREGARVRLQFEGWPAVQFSGWPSVAVGTFAATVSLMDASDDGAGRFRLLVVSGPGEIWPEPSYLRQGVRVLGWVQLGRVSLAYELWRRFNGFPPSPPHQLAGTHGADGGKAGGGAK